MKRHILYKGDRPEIYEDLEYHRTTVIIRSDYGVLQFDGSKSEFNKFIRCLNNENEFKIIGIYKNK